MFYPEYLTRNLVFVIALVVNYIIKRPARYEQVLSLGIDNMYIKVKLLRRSNSLKAGQIYRRLKSYCCSGYTLLNYAWEDLYFIMICIVRCSRKYFMWDISIG